MHHTIIETTPFGPVVLLWTRRNNRPKIVRVLLSAPGMSAVEQIARLYPQAVAASCPEIDAVAAAIQRMLAGEAIEIPLAITDLAQCSPFQQAVLRAEYRIPRGEVSTYRLIAAHIGMPTGARAVGTALAHNPFPLIVPCHRAIRSDRQLGGFQGGIAMKQALLSREGIPFDAAGRVACPHFHYETRRND